MTREELFSVFPRPWRLSDEETGAEVLQVDTLRMRDDDSVIALADLIVTLGNGAEE